MPGEWLTSDAARQYICPGMGAASRSMQVTSNPRDVSARVAPRAPMDPPMMTACGLPEVRVMVVLTWRRPNGYQKRYACLTPHHDSL